MKNPVLSVSGKEAGKSLVAFLAERKQLSRKKAKALLDARLVFVNGRRVWMARHPLRRGDQVRVEEAPAVAGLDQRAILYRDRHYLVANKPAGILSIGPGSLEETLRTLAHIPTLLAVHRLDRETSGCQLFARTETERDAILPLFRERDILKTYQAIARGRWPPHRTSLRAAINGKEAITRVRILDARDEASHLQVLIETGRTHQIRRHLAQAHHPVLGDKQYGTQRAAPLPCRAARHMLHARSIRFRHPITGKTVAVAAPPPADFRRCLRDLRLK